ncbi:MAG: SGNH/GDSL hydrolase family protein [Micromonosporaceae bacterium]
MTWGAMRQVLPALAVALAAVTSCSHTGHSRPPASYYLSLGDSLSQGVQPNSAGDSVPTRDGYADKLYGALRPHNVGLRLVKLGCPGETTATMIKGGICSYTGGSQMAAAVRFLRAHQGRVRLITIDIGGNDPGSCITKPTIRTIASCIGRFIPEATANLTEIMTRLREAGGGVRIIGMTYYLPVLAQWRNGLAGQALARVSARLASGYNGLLADVYKESGAGVADVFSAFHTTDFGHEVTLAGFGKLPRNVAAICQWTWQCAPPPRGPDQHANQAGYGVIARTFLRAHGSRTRPAGAHPEHARGAGTIGPFPP